MRKHPPKVVVFALTVAISFLNACTIIEGEDKYALFRELNPRSILVLPPINESVDVKATYSWLSTATKPIAEQGFYVFPVAVVDELMKENGLPTPEDMHAVSLKKIDEIIGADAVMYVTIDEYGQKFELFKSVTRVSINAELVDVKTGRSLWSGWIYHTDSNTDDDTSDRGWLSAIIGAALAQISGSRSDAAHDLSSEANKELFRTSVSSLLLGPRHPGYEEQVARAEAKAAAKEKQAVANELQTVPSDAAAPEK